MTTSGNAAKLWAVVPAAGIGRRMGGDCPKQYIKLSGQPVLSHTLSRLAGLDGLSAIVVALHKDDREWETIAKPAQPDLLTVTGGEERCHSVFNALEALKPDAGPDDWVLVHDAARPCVRLADINRLLKKINDHPAGGLLALKMTDTVKLANSDGQVSETVDRSRLWRALTPQVFRYRILHAALHAAIEQKRLVTDEAQALESAGYQALLVEGNSDNIKITTQQDLLIAALYLQNQSDTKTSEIQ